MTTSSETVAENRVSKLPPAARDWQVYRLVKVEQLTTREAATKLGISQTRVCQLVERIVEYMTDVAPGSEEPEARGRRLYIAESVAAERIDFLFGEVVASYRQSKGPQAIIREVPSDFGPPKTTTTIKQCHGEARLATAAARLATMGAKLPVNTFIAMQPEDIEPESPPVEDCSALAGEQAVTAKGTSPAVAASGVANDVFKSDATGEKMLNVLNSRPVQSAVQAPTGSDLPLPKQRQRAAFLNQ